MSKCHSQRGVLRSDLPDLARASTATTGISRRILLQELLRHHIPSLWKLGLALALVIKQSAKVRCSKPALGTHLFRFTQAEANQAKTATES